MTLATATSASDIWTSNEFYAFDPKGCHLIFTSSSETLHARQFMANPQVAANIVLNTKIVGKIQGMQIKGRIINVSDSSHHKMIYIKRFPYAAMSIKELWAVEIEYAKFTDNALGFGVKLHYPEATDAK